MRLMRGGRNLVFGGQRPFAPVPAWPRCGLLCALVLLSPAGVFAIDAAALPLPYPANYPSANYVPPGLELRNTAGIGSRNLAALEATLPEPRGIEFGHLLLHPFAAFDATYTDNSARARFIRNDDELLEYAAGLNAVFKPRECLTANFNYEFGWHDYSRDTVKDYLSHQLSGEVTLDRVGVEGLSLIFSDSYFQTSNSSALENEIIQFTRYNSNRAQARAQYKYNRFKISGAYANSFSDYFSRANASSDYVQHSGTLEGSWQWLPGSSGAAARLEIFENFQYSRTNYNVQELNDYDALTALTGVRGRYSKLTYSVAVGYANAVPLHETQTHSGSAFNASIGYAPHRRINVDITASRAFQAGVRTGSSIETDLNTTLAVLLTRRGKLSFTYTRNFSRHFDSTDQLSVAYGTRFDYKLARNAALNAGFTRYERSATFGFGDFTVNEARAGFKLTW